MCGRARCMLVGENGAGKSTLMNILAGVHRPDAGEITFGGRTCAGFASTHAAQQRGVSMVFQERSLFGPLSVAENIFAGRLFPCPNASGGLSFGPIKKQISYLQNGPNRLDPCH